MEIGEIITDALTYPFNNIKALVIYAVLGIVAAFVLVLTGVSVGTGIGINSASLGVLGFVGIIITILIYLLIMGFGLDIIKIGIDKGDGSPDIDFGRQVANGIKLLIVTIIYLIIPFIITALVMYINNTLGLIVGTILIIVFAFALYMGQCRLADTEDLAYSANIIEAIKDALSIGIVKILAVIILLIIIGFILTLIVSIFNNFGSVGTFIGALLQGILSIYLTFVQYRAIGLLYSDA